jgi:uncharacterized protein (DUF58 family)
MRLDARGLVEGILSGRHRSPHQGVSIEFADHMEYTPGDDLRTIDWRVFGRTDKLYIKRFLHETDLTARIMVDSSGSMAYGEGDTMKYRSAGVFALALAYLLLRQGDRVEIMAASDTLRARVPARPGLGHYRAIADLLENHAPEGQTDLSTVLDGEVERTGRRRLVVVLSDGFEDPDLFFKPLRALKARGCSVLLVHVLHGDEIDFPFDGVRDFRSLEDSGRLVTEPHLIRSIYLDRMTKHLDAIVTHAKRSGIMYQRMNTVGGLENSFFELLRKGLS